MSGNELILLAEKARNNSYSPYSNFAVGAALLCKSGKVYTGCNVENKSFSSTCCAERVAFFKAVSEGETEFSAIAVIGGKAGESGGKCVPCGVCLQVMSEFCDKSFKIVLGDVQNTKIMTLSQLLPHSFSM